MKPAAGCRPLAYSSPEAVQTTGTVAISAGKSVDSLPIAEVESLACDIREHAVFNVSLVVIRLVAAEVIDVEPSFIVMVYAAAAGISRICNDDPLLRVNFAFC